MFVGFDWKNSKRLLKDFRNFEDLMVYEERAVTGKLQISFYFFYYSEFFYVRYALCFPTSLPTVLMPGCEFRIFFHWPGLQFA